MPALVHAQGHPTTHARASCTLLLFRPHLRASRFEIKTWFWCSRSGIEDLTQDTDKIVQGSCSSVQTRFYRRPVPKISDGWKDGVAILPVRSGTFVQAHNTSGSDWAI